MSFPMPRLSAFGLIAASLLLNLLVPQDVYPQSEPVADTLLDIEYEIYTTVLNQLPPMYDIEVLAMQTNPGFRPPVKQRMLIREKPIDGYWRVRSAPADLLPGDISEQTRKKLIDDYFRRSRESATIQQHFPDSLTIRVVDENDMEIYLPGKDGVASTYGWSAIIEFSRVGFDADSSLALLTYSYEMRDDSGRGYVVLLERSKEGWRIRHSHEFWGTVPSIESIKMR